MKNFHRSGDDVTTLVVEDCTGRKLLKFKANSTDDDALAHIWNQHVEKYNNQIFVKSYSNLPKNAWESFIESLSEFKW